MELSCSRPDLDVSYAFAFLPFSMVRTSMMRASD